MNYYLKCIICLTTYLSFSQVQLKSEINIDKITNFIGRDNFDNYYYTIDNEFVKLSSANKYVYKNIGLGKITDSSIENPLQIVLLYGDFNTVVLLDNQLNEIQKIDFNQTNPFVKVSAIGLAAQNKLWIYDDISQRFGLYDFVKASVHFLSNTLPFNVKKVKSNYNYFCFIGDSESYYSISFFGTISNLGKLPVFQKLSYVNANKIIYLNNNNFFLYDFTTNISTDLIINEKSCIDFFFKDGILSIFTQNKITNYQIDF